MNSISNKTYKTNKNNNNSSNFKAFGFWPQTTTQGLWPNKPNLTCLVNKVFKVELFVCLVRFSSRFVHACMSQHNYSCYLSYFCINIMYHISVLYTSDVLMTYVLQVNVFYINCQTPLSVYFRSFQRQILQLKLQGTSGFELRSSAQKASMLTT